MSGNWLANELTCPTSCKDVGQYLHLKYFCYLSVLVITRTFFFLGANNKFFLLVQTPDDSKQILVSYTCKT